MDALLAAAARALAAGDALGALRRVALRDDPPALAMRGIAMAQLGEFARARALLRRAARAFGVREPMSHARCVVAEAEVALAMRDLDPSWSRALPAAAAGLDRRGDVANAAQAWLVAARGALLCGRLDEAAGHLIRVDAARLPPTLAAVAHLASAELSLRQVRTGPARVSLAQAQQAAVRAGVPALQAEVAQAQSVLRQPAARRTGHGGHAVLTLAEVEALLASPALVLDACRRGLGAGGQWVSLVGRPVLFTLAQALAEAWPGDADRVELMARAFRARRPDETHRARLRVEIGRLRALVAGLAGIVATPGGFRLQAAAGRPVVVLVPLLAGGQAALLALLSDGAAWSTASLAQAMGSSQRTVQRALAALQVEGRVRSVGQGRARGWLAPSLWPECTTILLLPAVLALH